MHFRRLLPALFFIFTSPLGLQAEEPAEPPHEEVSVGGWNFAVENPVREGKTLKGNGWLILPEALGGYPVNFPGFTLTGKNDLKTGTSSENCALQFRNDLYLVNDAVLEKKGKDWILRIGKLGLDLDWIGGPRLEFRNVVIDSSGKILSSDTVDQVYEFESYNRYQVRINRLSLSQEGPMLGGSLRPGWWPEGVAGKVPFGKLKYLGGGYFSGESEESILYRFAGWELAGTGIVFGPENITLRSNRLFYRLADIPLGELVFGIEEYLSKGALIEGPIELPLFGGRTTLHRGRFDDDGLTCQCFVTLPEFLGEEAIFIEGLTLSPDGGLDQQNTVYRYAFDLGVFYLEMSDIWLTVDGLRASEMAMTLPPSMGGRKIRIINITLNNEGVFQFRKRSDISQFSLWNFNIRPEDIVFGKDTISFEGFADYPYQQNNWGDLSGRSTTLTALVVGLDGTIRDFRLKNPISPGNAFYAPLGSRWGLVVRNSETLYENGKPWVIFREGILNFPSGFTSSGFGFADLMINPETGEWRFDRFRLTGPDLRVYYGEKNLWLDIKAIKPVFDSVTGALTALDLAGTATLPPADAASGKPGPTVAIRNFRIGMNGTVMTLDLAESR